MASGHSGLLSWTIDPSPSRTTVTVQGEMDLSTIDPLRSALDESITGDDVVIIDLGDVAFMDSTGLRLLLDLQRTVLGRGGALFLAGVSAPVERVLEVSGMASFFEQRLPVPEIALAREPKSVG